MVHPGEGRATRSGKAGVRPSRDRLSAPPSPPRGPPSPPRGAASRPTGAPTAPFIQRSGVSRPCLAIRSISGPDRARLLQVPLDLERDEVADAGSPGGRGTSRSCGSRSRGSRVLHAEDGGVEAVPDLLRDREDGRLQLGGRRLGVLVHPAARRPCRRGRRRRSPPSPRRCRASRARGPSRRASRGRGAQVALLEDEGDRLREGGVRDAGEERVVDEVQRDTSARRCARARGRRCCSPCSPSRPSRRGCAGAPCRPGGPRPRRAPSRAPGRRRCSPRAPAPAPPGSRGRGGCAGCPSRTPRGRVPLPRDRVELGLGVRPAVAEARVPDVERLERPAEAPLHERGRPRRRRARRGPPRASPSRAPRGAPGPRRSGGR